MKNRRQYDREDLKSKGHMSFHACVSNKVFYLSSVEANRLGTNNSSPLQSLDSNLLPKFTRQLDNAEYSEVNLCEI